MRPEKFTFLVVENAVDVCEGIERRMRQFVQWESIGYCTGVKDAIVKIKQAKPQLIFLDWSLNGGSAYEILQQIQNFGTYNPYIIFNTGFQSDNPEIPQEIINRYKVDKYLVKPFWETLRMNLASFLNEAEIKANQASPKSRTIWIENERGAKIQLQLDKIVCIVQHPEKPRSRNFYTQGELAAITIPLTWEKCYELLDIYEINYFISKSRNHLVVKSFIEKFEKPFVWLEGIPFKIEIVKEKIHEFVAWFST